MEELQTELGSFYDGWANKINDQIEVAKSSLFDLAKQYRVCCDESKTQFHHDIKTTWNNLDDRLKGFCKYHSFVRAIKTDRFIEDVGFIPKKLSFTAVQEIVGSDLESEDKKNIFNSYENDSDASVTDSDASVTEEPTKANIRKKIKEVKQEKVKVERTKKVKDVKINNLFEGSAEDNIKNIVDGSVDCLIIDPPYGINFKSNHGSVFEPVSNDDVSIFDTLNAVFGALNTKLKEDSHIYVFTSWKVYPQLIEIMNKHYNIKNCLVWVKNNWSMGDLDKNYAEQHELIVFATKGNGRLLKSWDNKRPSNVINCDRVVGKNQTHPTEKPVSLIKGLIENSTVEGETVLDCFAGSGSLGMACIDSNRNFILIEKEPRYIEIIKERMSKL